MFNLCLQYLSKSMLMIACLLMSISLTVQARTPLTHELKEAMAVMKAETEKLGVPRVEDETLYFGNTKINGDFTLVDSLKERFGGTATFFVKRGNEFVRVSTNVMKDGNRAVGTILDPNGPAIAAIKQGKAYYGIADVLGNISDTGYEPIKNPNNQIIGIYYVGHSLFQDKSSKVTK